MKNDSCFRSANNAPLMIALTMTLLMMVIELAGGIISGSLALISDSGHMLTDTLSLSVCLFASIFSLRPATKEKTYGYYRLEILSALFNGSLLMIVALVIFYEAAMRFYHPAAINGDLMIYIAVAGLIINIIGAVLLQKGSGESLNIKGAFLHILSDAASSIGVILGGFVIIFTGWRAIDPILSILIGLLIMRGAIMLISESADVLLESVPSHINIEDVIAGIKKIAGVVGVHDVHIWSISTGNLSFSAHVKIRDITTSKSDALIADINRLLRENFGISHTTLQFECEECERHDH